VNNTDITEWFAGDDVVSWRITFDEAGFCETQRPSDWVGRARTHFLHREFSTRRQGLVRTKSNTHRQILVLILSSAGAPSSVMFYFIGCCSHHRWQHLHQPYVEQELCSVEHGICPIAEFTSPWLNCAHSNRIPYPLFCWCCDVHVLLKNIKWILKSHWVVQTVAEIS